MFTSDSRGLPTAPTAVRREISLKRCARQRRSRRDGNQLARWCATAPILAAAAAILVSAACAATESEDAKARASLKQIKSRIGIITREINQASTVRDAKASSLREVELRIASASDRLLELAARRGRQSERRSALAARRLEISRTIAAHRQALALEVRATYVLGREDRIKLLLNQENPRRIARAVAYSAYFARTRARHIRELAAALATLHEVDDEISQTTDEIAQLERHAEEARAHLTRQRDRRRRVLAALALAIRSKGHQLAGLRRDANRLEDLLRKLRREFSELALPTVEREPFTERKGTLEWPVAGAVQRRFGTPRAQGGLTWHGVVIGARAGQEVHSVSHGRIAFADWLRGFGLLVIVDHGEGYMSLYGYNQSVLKEVGDWVDAGETIAHVGDSGGQRDSGLYFEIRHLGTPEDPSRWCRTASARSAAPAALVSS